MVADSPPVPEFAATAARVSITGLATIPTMLDDQIMVAFNLYPTEPRQWSDEASAVAPVLANLARSLSCDLPGSSAALDSTVLGPAIELAFTAGHIVTARGAAVPPLVWLVGMTASGALLVDASDRLTSPQSSGFRPADRDKRGNARGQDDREQRPDKHRCHDLWPVTQSLIELIATTV